MPPGSTSSAPAVSSGRALLVVLVALVLFGSLSLGLYRTARLRHHGLVRRALVVRNQRLRSVHLLTFRYVHAADTLTATYSEAHRRWVQQLPPGDSVTLRLWPAAPRRVEIEVR